MAGVEDAPTGPGEEDEGIGASGDDTSELDELPQLVPQYFPPNRLNPAQEERRHILAQAALSYAQRGWKVIPVRWVDAEGHCTCKQGAGCPSAGKHPIHDGWPDLATDDPMEVASWWREPPDNGIAEEWWPEANVGIVTGQISNVFVLDEDTYNGGEKTLDNYRVRHGDLPLTRIQVTGGGGRHYLWTYPGFQIHNNVGRTLGQGLDIKGDRGFIVMPPSVSGKGPYLIENPAHDIDPVPAPAWLLELLKAYTNQQRGIEGSPTDLAPAALVSAYAQAALASETDTVRTAPVGARNERLNAAAFALGSLGGIGLIDEATARKALTDAALAAGLGAPEIAATFRSGWKSGLENPRTDLHLRGVTDQGFKFSQDEYGLGARMVYLYGAILKWIPGLQRWMLYMNGWWTSCKIDTANTFAIKMIDNLYDLGKEEYEEEPLQDGKGGTEVNKDAEELTPREKFWEWTRKQRNKSRTINTTALFQMMEGGRIDADLFDSEDMKFVWANGLMDLTTGELGPHDPLVYSTMSSSIVYDPGADQSLWLKFLSEVMPDPEMRSYLQRISGYSLTGSTQEQAAVLHWGEGANGKSVWLEVMAYVAGSYAQVVPANTLLLKPVGTIPNDVARMRGRRFLQVSETPQNKKLDEEVVKSLTGGELITARFMRGEFFDFKPTGKINLVTNHLPHLSPSHSIWRRLHIVPWEITIPEDEQDKELAKKIIQFNSPGVAAWAVQGCLEWQLRGLDPPPKAQASKKQYRHEENRLAQWLLDECDIVDSSPGVVVGRRVEDLYESWNHWYKRTQNTIFSGSQRSFTNMMKAEGYPYSNVNHDMRGFPGVQLKPPRI